MDAITSRLWEQIKTKCGTCGAPATHSVTDAKQVAETIWNETAPRHGCAAHPVESMVHFLDGTSTTYKKYIADSVAVQ